MKVKSGKKMWEKINAENVYKYLIAKIKIVKI
jgi:hypothetical protein